jgi:DNA-binding transcriptional LysR family regulator
LLVFAEPPWPADMQVYELGSEWIGPVLSPRFARYEQLRNAPVGALLDEALLHTTSRPQAWPSWAQQHALDATALKYGQGFEHLYYLLEAAVAGLGVAIAPSRWWPRTCKAGRLVAPWGSSANPGAAGVMAAQARRRWARPATGAMAQG